MCVEEYIGGPEFSVSRSPCQSLFVKRMGHNKVFDVGQTSLMCVE